MEKTSLVKIDKRLSELYEVNRVKDKKAVNLSKEES